MLVTNPNPDRARRAAAPAPAADGPTQAVAPTTAVIPAPAPAAAATPRVAATATGVFGIMPALVVCRDSWLCESVAWRRKQANTHKYACIQPKSKYTKYRLPI